MADGPDDEDALRREMAALWAKHRSEEGVFRLRPVLGGGVIVTDMTRVPIRLWGVRIESGTIRVCTAGVEGGLLAMSAEVAMATLLEGKVVAAREIPPSEVAGLLGLVPGKESWAELSVRRFSESLPDARLRARLPLDKMTESEIVRIDAAGFGECRAAMDMEALGLLSSCEDYAWRDYAYYAVRGEEGTLDAARRMVRHQAAKIFPLFAVVIANRFGVRADLEKQAKFLVDRAPVKSAMDIAKASGDDEAMMVAKASMDALVKPPALLDSLEKAFTPPATSTNPNPAPAINRAAWNRISGIPFPAYGLKPEYVAMCMSELPPDWFPKKGADWKLVDWQAFTDMVATVGGPLRRLTGSSPEVLYEGCAGKWSELRDRVVRAMTDTRPPGGDPEAVKVIERAIDWKMLEKLPRTKVEGAAVEIAARLGPTLPAGVTEKDVSDWIVRLVAPPNEREAIAGACNQANTILNLMTCKVLLPLAAAITGDPDPLLSTDQFARAEASAASLLFEGKSAVKVFETISSFHQVGTAIQSAGTKLPHEMAMDESERSAREELERVAAKARLAIGDLASRVGIDVNAPKDYPIPFEPVIVAPNGVYLCFLSSKAQLDDEGRGFRGDPHGRIDSRHGGTAYGFKEEELNADGSYGLNMCIGYYSTTYNNCKAGGMGISARLPKTLPDDPDAPFSRISFNSIYKPQQNAKGGWELRSMEHAGRMNSTAPELAKEAFAWLFQAVRDNDLPNTMDQMQQHAQAENAKVSRMSDICGYEWSEMPRISHAVRAWNTILPKRARVGLEEFARLPEVVAVADELSPGWQVRAEMRGNRRPGPR